MAVVALHLYDEASHASRKLVERKMSRIPTINEHILAGTHRQDAENRGWYTVKIVVHYAVESEEGIDADVYAVKIDHIKELRQHGLVPKPPRNWKSKAE